MKRVVFLLITALLILITPLLVSFGQLVFSDAKIVPVYFTRYYLSRIEKDEDERRLLIEYLEARDYALIKSNEERMVFIKDGEVKEVLTTDIKNVIRDGRLTSDFHLPK
ncbi:MAG: hypothetical protein GXY11_00095 [Clostridiales bacterium]|jgi:hypothetical protein|nr:hypothetical protein [Clostridiales bacterium]